MRILTIILVLTMLLSCGRKHDANSIPDSGADNDSVVEVHNSMDSGSFAGRIAMQERKVARMRQSMMEEPSYKILSECGYLYFRTGDYIKALEYFQEADDSLKHVPDEKLQMEDAVKLWGNQANLYCILGLYEEALEKNMQAIDVATNHDEQFILVDLWRMRNAMFSDMSMLDSAQVCLEKSLDCMDRLNDEKLRRKHKGRLECTKYWIYIEHPDYAPDSIAHAIKEQEKYLTDCDMPPGSRNTNLMLTGRGYALLGDYQKGIPMMESALAVFRENHDKESEEFCLMLLADSYARAGSPKLIGIYRETIALHDSIMKNKQNDVLLGKDYSYRTKELKTENKLLETELSATRQRTLIMSLIGVIIMLTVIYISYHNWYIQKKKAERLKLDMDNLLSDRIELNSKIEQLNEELARKQKSSVEKVVVNQKILERGDETKFRRMFSELYPGFVEKLRKDFPSLTAGNELLVMMIKLHKSVEETALALGISKESVITARYRLRTRFNLPKDTDLNEFIQSRS